MIREEGIAIPFSYAAGETASRFLVTLRDEGVLLASRCLSCAFVAVPATSICPGCQATTASLVEVGPKGTVISFTTIPGKGTFGLVRLDRGDGAMIHRLLGPPERYAMGARVSVRLARERTGTILDIEGFELLEET